MPSSFDGDGKPLANTVVEGDGSLDVEAVEKAAVWLRKKLGLTIIGFDIVVSACLFKLHVLTLHRMGVFTRILSTAQDTLQIITIVSP